MSARSMTRAHAEPHRGLTPPQADRSRRDGRLRVSVPGDAHEREADRAADAVVAGRALPARGLSLSRMTVGHVQREESGKPKGNAEKYKEAGRKAGEAFLETAVGKKLKARILEDPLVKGAREVGEQFISTLPGKVITGVAAAGAVAALAATHTELPVQLPEIPLDALYPGLKVKLTWEGPVDNPTKAMITFTLTEQVAKGARKPAKTRAEQQREENARMAVDLARFRAGMRYAPGTPQARQQQMEDDAVRRVVEGRLGRLRPPSLLDKELELKPIDEVAPVESPERKKEASGGVMRKAAGDTAADVAAGSVPPIVHEVIDAPGQPLDPGTRSFMEARFGHDFSRVRVHADARAAQSARAIRAHAYTVGQDVVFDAGRYATRTPGGRHLLAHELAHTVQQERSRGLLSRWSAEGHEAITHAAARKVLQDPLFVWQVARHSGLMDYRSERLLVTGPMFLMGIIKGEGPEHGEDGNYSTTSETAARSVNLLVQRRRLQQAVSRHRDFDQAMRSGRPVHEVGSIASRVYAALGDACHIAQDRGSHGEGVQGKGHDDPRAKARGRSWSPDSSRDNPEGYQAAIDNTTELFQEWKSLTHRGE